MSMTRDELLDLSQWHFIQFANEQRMQEALARYQAYLRKQVAA